MVKCGEKNQKFSAGFFMKARKGKMNAALCGTYYHSIDAKGRMSFPTKLREILGAEFYLCMGHDDHYIAVYSPEEFEIYQTKLNSIPGKAGSVVRRKLLSCTDRQVPDKQGRILISPILKENACLEKDVVVIGSSNHAEIWDQKLWDDFNGSVSIDDISDAISQITL